MPQAERHFAGPIVSAAVQVAEAVNAGVLFAYVQGVSDFPGLVAAIKPPTKVILVCRDAKDEQRAKGIAAEVMNVPAFDLTRMGQIKITTLLAFSQGLLKAGDVFVFLSGVAGREIDTLVTMRVGEEYELF
ncbi:MAG: hypothetical protein ACE5EX_06510, partial [Phycisphaerae bacterium]